MAGKTTEETYKKFVKHPNDLAGKIAFSDYEKDKITYIKNKSNLTDDDIDKYIENVTQDTQIERLKDSAENHLQSVFQLSFETELSKIRASQIADLKLALKENNPSFLSICATNIFCSFLFAALVIVGFIIVHISGGDILAMLGLKVAKPD